MTDDATAGRRREVFEGVLLGTAVGDALGLPAEGMSRDRVRRRWAGQWRHRFLFGRGMVSDDTEHAFFVAQALLAHPFDASAFQRCLAWKLRLWLLGVPAGVGLATLQATLKLWLGFGPERSGVRSAGNGPAMRSAILGAYFADEPARRRAYVRASTRLTHTDPKAETAALAVAEGVAWAMNRDKPLEQWLARLPSLGSDAEWPALCETLSHKLMARASVQEFAAALGLQHGVSGYAYHSVPVALYAWLRHPGDFRAALTAALDCGGDTDTVGAIVGALSGTTVGQGGMPTEWIQGICEWPRSTSCLRRVAARLAEQKQAGRALGPVRYFWPALVARNGVFLAAVLGHGLRRLAPPY
jgi:ADP-ribosyl-[dinitrogen reductase] hydrolase